MKGEWEMQTDHSDDGGGHRYALSFFARTCPGRLGRVCGQLLSQPPAKAIWMSKEFDIALATSDAFPELSQHERGVIDELKQLGLVARPVVWTDPGDAWHDARLVVIQSTWDSHLKPDEFLRWVDRVQAVKPLHNTSSLVRWNFDKSYLLELEEAGVAVTPTVWLKRGETVDLDALMRHRNWDRVVIKPTISANANETHVLSSDTPADAQAALDLLARHHDVMVQPYLVAFESEGERSYIFFGGVFSHGVHRPPTLKSAPRGFDLAVPIPHATGPELDLANFALGKLPATPLYARVDVATNNDGIVRLQEIELVEPCLFTSLVPGAAARFARVIAECL